MGCGKAIHVVALPPTAQTWASGFAPQAVPSARTPAVKSPRFRLYVVAGGSIFTAAAIVAFMWMVFGRPKAPGGSLAGGAGPGIASSAADSSIPKPSPTPPAPVVLSTGQIAELATPSVVVVENYNENGQETEQGSGYIFSADGVVMTNYHVVRGAASLAVKIPGKEEQRVDSLIGYDVNHDVAALNLDGI